MTLTTILNGKGTATKVQCADPIDGTRDTPELLVRCLEDQSAFKEATVGVSQHHVGTSDECHVQYVSHESAKGLELWRVRQKHSTDELVQSDADVAAGAEFVGISTVTPSSKKQNTDERLRDILIGHISLNEDDFGVDGGEPSPLQFSFETSEVYSWVRLARQRGITAFQSPGKSLDLVQYLRAWERYAYDDQDVLHAILGEDREATMAFLREAAESSKPAAKAFDSILCCGEAFTPEGDYAEERCPICAEPVSASACEVCVHHLGVVGEDMFQLEKVLPQTEDFDALIRRLYASVKELGVNIEDFSMGYEESSEMTAAFQGIRKALLSSEFFLEGVHALEGGNYSATEVIKDNECLMTFLNGWDDYSMEKLSMALLESVCVSGTIVSSDGMCSGSAYSLYLQTPDHLEKLRSQAQHLLDQCALVVSGIKTNQDSAAL